MLELSRYREMKASFKSEVVKNTVTKSGKPVLEFQSCHVLAK